MATPTIPELRATLDAATNESERLTAMLALGRELLNTDGRQALPLATEALELAERMKDDHAVAKAMRLIGMIHISFVDYPRAHEYLERALLQYQRIGERMEIAHTMNVIGSAYENLGEYSKASEQYQSALALYEELGDRTNVAKLTSNLGMIYERRGEYVTALKYLQSALDLFEEVGDRGALATDSVKMGLVYKQLGEYTMALEQFQLAFRLHEEFGNRKGVADATSSIGNVYRALGEYAEALEQHQSAFRLHEEFGNRKGVANATSNIGNVYRDLGEHAKAMEQFQSALAIFEELGNRHGVANVTVNIGLVYFALGNHAKSMEQYQSALTLYEQLNERQGIAVTTGEIGGLYEEKQFEQYNPALAEEYFLRAVELSTEIGNKDFLKNLHQHLARLYKEQGRWQQAHEHLAISHELKEELNTIEAHKKVQQFEHLKQIAEMEKRRALEQAEEQAERRALGLRTQLLEVQLDRQRAELAAQAMHLAKQTEMLGEFRNDLRVIMREGGDPLATVKQIKEKLKELPCEAIDWTKFDAEFRQTYPEFQTKLLQRHPELSGMELKISALLKLKLTSPDIAKLLCLSERSVEGHRLRIRKKMGLTQGEDVHTVLAGV